MSWLRPTPFVAAAMLCGCNGDDGGGPPRFTRPPPPGTGPQTCVSGRAGDFACLGIDLARRMGPSDLGGSAANDIWGWADSQSMREYALVGLTNGTAFVDVTDPLRPVLVGRLATQTTASTWRDIKVYQDHAYVVADGAGSHGMQVFDLTRLRTAVAPATFVADVVYDGFRNAHNVAIDEATAYAFAVGSDTCNGGLHMIDIGTPIVPQFAGCYAVADTHDTQCVVYAGPDAAYAGREICFSSNGDHFGITDVTLKSAPVAVATAIYPQLGFVHQGWLTEDHRYFLIGDELDELSFRVPTRTHVFDVTDLDTPVYLYAYEGPTAATDHNLYVVGDHVFEANYESGLSVLEIGDLAIGEIAEIAFFDTYPASDNAGFMGAWGVYPFLPSGTLLVSDISNGLFVLALR